MLDYLRELMLRSYYLAENTVGRFHDDRRALFSAYAKIFLLSEEEDKLFEITQSQDVTAITSEREYHQYLRLRQFICMRSRHMNDPFGEVIALKGTAFTQAISYQMIRDAKEVRTVACENLTLAAEQGVVPALIAFGVLQAEGIVFGKDTKRGMEKIRRAADWNSIEGLLCALYYDPAEREKYLVRLRGCLQRAGHAEVFGRAADVYGEPSADECEYLLLEKAFRQGIVKRDIYSKPYARLVYSRVLCLHDKETLLLSPNSELFAEASALPLKLGETAMGKAQLPAPRPNHQEESDRVTCAIGNFDLRAVQGYRPVCFVSDSRFMLDYYAALLCACFRSAHTERIEVSDLGAYEFEPTKNHIFVRSCDEDAFNMYLLSFCGEISEGTFDAVKNFLQSDKRKKFRLNRPGVALDLSEVLPVCFSDRENAKRLKPYCDLIRIAEPDAQEKTAFVQGLLDRKSALYGIKKLSVQEGLFEKLSAYGMDDIDGMLDAVIRDHRMEELTLTEPMMLPYFKGVGGKHNLFGFGGSFHDDHE